jgi:predicted DNA-binding transcriptional regulator AlpA
MSPQSTALSQHEKHAGIGVLRKRELCKLFKVSPWTIDRWIKQGYFKPPTFLTPTSNVGVWTERYVAAFLEKRERARRTKPMRGMFKQRRVCRVRAQGGDDAR